MLPAADHVIRETLRLAEGQTLDGHGQIYTLPEGFNFAPIVAQDIAGATIQNLTIIAPADSLERITGLITVRKTTGVTIRNVTLQAASRGSGGKSALPLIIWDTSGTLVENSRFSHSPHWNIESTKNRRLLLRRVESHRAHFDGIKLATSNYDTVIDSCHCHSNGFGRGGVGDGIDLTHGATRVNIVNTVCENNTNGICFKYAPWHKNHETGRVPCYGVSIRGGSLSHNNSSGLFAQGFSGPPPDGVEGDAAPWPIGFTISDVVAERNTNHGFLVGAGTWTLKNCTAYRNGGHGFYISELSKYCRLSDCLAVANADANFNIWGRRTDLDHCTAYGVDVWEYPADDWQAAPPLSRFGINYQWKPARGADHGEFWRVVNKYSKKENDKPRNLPAHAWHDDTRTGGPNAR